MDQHLTALQLTIGFLSFLLLLLGIRLLRIAIRRRTGEGRREKSDLLLDTLREQAIREQQARGAYADLAELHRVVMANMPVGVLVIDENDRLQLINPRASQILDVSPELGQPLVEASGTLNHARAKLEALGERGPLNVETEGAQGKRQIELSLVPLPGQHVLLSLVDQTRLRRLEDHVRVKRDLELMGEMASGITHEVKNALATIQGHVQMLAYGDPHEHGAHIMAEVDGLLRFVREFMRTSKNEQLDIRPLAIDEWFAELANYWRDKGPVSFEQPPGHILIRGDRTLLTTVLNNLIRNGLESGGTGEPVPVRIWATRQERALQITIEDAGPGFAPEIRGRIFSPFVTAKKGGTGLGLFHSRKIMMAHDGSLRVEHGPPTRVICHFPEDFDEATAALD